MTLATYEKMHKLVVTDGMGQTVLESSGSVFPTFQAVMLYCQMFATKGKRVHVYSTIGTYLETATFLNERPV